MVGREEEECRKIKETEGEKEIREGCKSVAAQTDMNGVNGYRKGKKEKEKKQNNILQFEIYMKCGSNAKRLMLVANKKGEIVVN